MKKFVIHGQLVREREGGGRSLAIDDIIYSQISNNLSEILFSYISRHEKGNPDPDQKSFDGLSRFSRNSVIVS